MIQLSILPYLAWLSLSAFLSWQCESASNACCCQYTHTHTRRHACTYARTQALKTSLTFRNSGTRCFQHVFLNTPSLCCCHGWNYVDAYYLPSEPFPPLSPALLIGTWSLIMLMPQQAEDCWMRLTVMDGHPLQANKWRSLYTQPRKAQLDINKDKGENQAGRVSSVFP